MAIVGIGGLAWGAYRFNQTIKAPFLPRGEETVVSSEISELIALQTKDSDEDGLSDYDELYVYKTSLYLKDTDSDGFNDKQEIESGHDPNCPAGRDCGLPEPGSGTATQQISDTSELDKILNALSADQIREILLEAGVPKEELDQIDDQTLMQLYQEALIEQSATYGNQTGTSSGGSSQTSTNANMPDFKNMTVDEVRAFLLEQGVSEEELSQIDDETLMQTWQETLEEEGL